MAPKKAHKKAVASKKTIKVDTKPAVDLSTISGFEALEKLSRSEAVEEQTEKTKSLSSRVGARMQYHFQGRGHIMLYVRVSPKTNLTLWERVVQDTTAWDLNAPDKVPMGKSYWASLGSEYESEEDRLLYERLVILNENDPKDNQMADALLQFMKNHQRSEPLVEWSEMVQSVNQRNLVVLYRTLWRVFPGHSLHLARVAISILKALKRLDLHITYENMFAVMRDYFDAAMAKYLKSFATVKNGTALWWKEVRHFSDTILPVPTIDILFEATGFF